MAADLTGEVGLGLGEGAVRAPGADQQQLPERIQTLRVSVGDALGLGALLVEPAPPLLLILHHLTGGKVSRDLRR